MADGISLSVQQNGGKARLRHGAKMQCAYKSSSGGILQRAPPPPICLMGLLPNPLRHCVSKNTPKNKDFEEAD